MKVIKSLIEANTPFGLIARRRRAARQIKKFNAWKTSDTGLPMPHYGKFCVVREYAERFQLRVFVETGTYQGDMPYDMVPYTDRIFTIELSPNLYKKAKQRFAGYSGIEALCGDSSELLPGILGQVDSACLFWLDAHYSGGKTAKGTLDCPIISELESIFAHSRSNDHVVLIDDARCFDGTSDYPEMTGLKEYILNAKPNWSFYVKDDIIRCHRNME